MARGYFLDTNVLVYVFEPGAPDKQAVARQLIADHAPWVVSWQVVQEFCTVALHRFLTPLKPEFLLDFLDLLLAPHCQVYPTPALWRAALTIQREAQYHFYDSLVVAAAIESGAPVLYSEDLQHGRTIGGVEIRNPFLP